MRSDLTDITLVLDRSGSMGSCKEEAIGGMNTFVEEQKKLPGEAMFTMTQFDTAFEVVHSGVPIKNVPKLTLVPRGMTALYDAVGKAIVETGERLSKIPEADRPGLVVFVIVTDGDENSSREYTQERVAEMIKTQTDQFSWQFQFLGANIDTKAVSGGIGIQTSGNFNTGVIRNAYAAASNNVGRMRTAALQGQSISNHYTAEEQRAMSGDAAMQANPTDPTQWVAQPAESSIIP